MTRTRLAEIHRKTKETEITATVDLDGSGVFDVSTGIGFLDHMLTLFAKHGLFDLEVKAKGDVDVDYHHTVEDVGLVLGQAFKEALADKIGIRRYGFFILPMDESLARVVIDVGGASVDGSGATWTTVSQFVSRSRVGAPRSTAAASATCSSEGRDPAVDAIVIATRHDSHAQLAADARGAALAESPMLVTGTAPVLSSAFWLSRPGTRVTIRAPGLNPSLRLMAAGSISPVQASHWWRLIHLWPPPVTHCDKCRRRYSASRAGFSRAARAVALSSRAAGSARG